MGYVGKFMCIGMLVVNLLSHFRISELIAFKERREGNAWFVGGWGARILVATILF